MGWDACDVYEAIPNSLDKYSRSGFPAFCHNFLDFQSFVNRSPNMQGSFFSMNSTNTRKLASDSTVMDMPVLRDL